MTDELNINEIIIDEDDPIAKKCFTQFTGVNTCQVKKDLLKIINTAILEYQKIQQNLDKDDKHKKALASFIKEDLIYMNDGR